MVNIKQPEVDEYLAKCRPDGHYGLGGTVAWWAGGAVSRWRTEDTLAFGRSRGAEPFFNPGGIFLKTLDGGENSEHFLSEVRQAPPEFLLRHRILSLAIALGGDRTGDPAQRAAKRTRRGVARLLRTLARPLRQRTRPGRRSLPPC